MCGFYGRFGLNPYGGQGKSAEAEDVESGITINTVMEARKTKNYEMIGYSIHRDFEKIDKKPTGVGNGWSTLRVAR